MVVFTIILKLKKTGSTHNYHSETKYVSYGEKKYTYLLFCQFHY